MDDPKIHLPDLPFPAKLFCTVFFVMIGIGILASEGKVFLKYHMADGKPGFSVRDLIISFYGYPGVPLIEQKINLAPSPDHREFKGKVDYLIEWTRAGSSPKEEDFAPVVEILENRCVNCHDREAAASSSPFWEDRVVKYDLVAPVFSREGAVSAARLIHLTHIHLLTNVMIFVMTGAVVLLCRIRGAIKTVLVLLPFFAIALDIGSWWLTAFVCYRFAYAILIGGVLMGIGFVLQFIVVIYGLWLQRATAESP